MKRILLVTLFFLSVTCFSQKCDSLVFYRNAYIKQQKRINLTSQHFIKIYKYDRLFKYYSICKNKPSQWKYYKGWSIRVFEQ